MGVIEKILYSVFGSLKIKFGIQWHCNNKGVLTIHRCMSLPVPSSFHMQNANLIIMMSGINKLSLKLLHSLYMPLFSCHAVSLCFTSFSH